MAPEVSDGPGSAIILSHALGLLTDGGGVEQKKLNSFNQNTQKFFEIHQAKRKLDLAKRCEKDPYLKRQF